MSLYRNRHRRYEDFPKNMDSSLAHEFSIEMVDIVLLVTGMLGCPIFLKILMGGCSCL